MSEVRQGRGTRGAAGVAEVLSRPLPHRGRGRLRRASRSPMLWTMEPDSASPPSAEDPALRPGPLERPLALDATTMRALGHLTVDAVVELLTAGDTPVLRRATAAEMAARVPATLPEAPASFEALLETLRRDVLPFMGRHGHPGFFAFVPSAATFPGALGDFIAAALNIFAGNWLVSAGPSRLEQVVLEWFRGWVGYPPESAGVLVSGGSAANLTALACARESLLGAMTDRAVLYLSDQAHSSLARAARTLGFRPDQVRVLPSDADCRLPPAALVAAIQADAEAGRQPLCVVASAGTTNTGAVDPLAEIADICRQHRLWLHVDGAYGGFAAVTDEGRARLAGIERADSITLDPHKWLFQPYECGCLLVRDGRLLRRAFEIAPDYLKDNAVRAGEVNYADLGLQLTRSARALKVWLSLSYFGAAAFRAAITRAMDLAAYAERRIAASETLELVSPASLGIVGFRRRGAPGEDEAAVAARNAALIAGLEATGQALVSSTRLRGRYTVRLCVLSHTSGADEVDRVLGWFATATVTPAPAAAPTEDPCATVEDGWLGPPQISVDELRTLATFAGLSDELLGRVAAWARAESVAAGTPIVRRWDLARDFYVLLGGVASVERDGKVVDELRPGDHFGEVAALDWGASYSYSRTATVTAASAVKLLILGPSHLALLVRLAPPFAARLRAVAGERLANLAAGH